MRGKVLNHGVILWSAGTEDGRGEEALLVHLDNGDTLCIEQEGRQIVLDRSLSQQLRDELSRRLKAGKAGAA